MTDSTIRFFGRSFAVLLTLALVVCASSKVGTKDLFHASMIKSIEVELTTQEQAKGRFRRKDNEVSRKRKTPEELMEMLRDGKEKGYISGDFPVEGVEADRLAKTLYQQQLDAETAQSRLGKEETVVGSLSFILMRYPGGNWNQVTDRHLDVFLGGSDWSSIFYDALGCPRASDDLMVRGDDEDEFGERRRLEFQQAIPEYPMLGRIWDMYTDVKYEAKEIDQLRKECLRVKASATNDQAVKGLDKLIYACDEGLRSGLGLFLASD